MSRFLSGSKTRGFYEVSGKRFHRSGNGVWEASNLLALATDDATAARVVALMNEGSVVDKPSAFVAVDERDSLVEIQFSDDDASRMARATLILSGKPYELLVLCSRPFRDGQLGPWNEPTLALPDRAWTSGELASIARAAKVIFSTWELRYGG